jgi:uncharacterized protein with GYD domain
MAFYMFTGNYTREAMQAMVAKPHDREPVVRQFIEAAGGKLHHLFMSLGTTDVVAITEFPDEKGIAGVSLAVGAAGSITHGATTRLLTSKEFMDCMKKAKKIAKHYQAPQG